MNKIAYLHGYMEKKALNIAKEVALAKSVGIVPFKGNWKWALRQLRAPSKKGGPLMLSGKALAKAKEKIGLLSNNFRQKLLSGNRKARLGFETALSEAGDIVKGQKGYVDSVDDIIAHTHPGSDKYFLKQHLDNPEVARLFDPTLAASPSGAIGPPKGMIENIKRKAAIGRERFTRLISRREADLNKKREILNKTIENIQDALHNAKGDMPRISKSNLRNYLMDLKQQSHNAVLAMNYHNTPELERILNLSNKLSRMERIEQLAYLSRGGDYAALRSMKKVPHNIISPQTTGVHKFRKNLPGEIRSVYFKGGFDA
jgi:hypothetical protein